MIQKIRQYNYVNLIVMIALFLLAAFLLFGKAVAYAQPESGGGGYVSESDAGSYVPEGDAAEAGAEYVALDISQGSVYIDESGYRYGDGDAVDFDGVYVITGRSDKAYGIEVAGGEHTVVFESVTIDQRTLQGCFPLSIRKDARVKLNLNGDNILYAGSGNCGITLESGAALEMDGFGSGTLAVQSYPESRNNVVYGEKAIYVPDGAFIDYPAVTDGNFVELYAGMNRKEFSQIFVYSGQSFFRMEFNLNHTEHVLSAEPDCSHEQICILCGAVIHGKAKHTPGPAATCTEPQTCTVCGTVLKEPEGHKGVWRVVEYTDYGLYRKECMTCKVCGETLNRTVPVEN